MQDAPHKRILILGDGFAGLTVAMELEKKLAQDLPQEYGHPASFIMPPFYAIGIKYDDRNTYDMVTIIDGGCRNNHALSRRRDRCKT
jgi:hypothetical protein